MWTAIRSTWIDIRLRQCRDLHHPESIASIRCHFGPLTEAHPRRRVGRLQPNLISANRCPIKPKPAVLQFLLPTAWPAGATKAEAAATRRAKRKKLRMIEMLMVCLVSDENVSHGGESQRGGAKQGKSCKLLKC